VDPRAARALARLNVHRQAAGLPPVTLDDTLSHGCAAHAAYLVRHHDHPSTRDLGAHGEDPKLPGYTKEGEQAGHSSVIETWTCTQGPEQFDPSDVMAVDGLMSTFFHRISLIHPNLRHVGFGWAHGRREKEKDNVWVTVIDIRDSWRRDGPGGWVLLYPADGQNDVPTTFENFEVPNPTPPEGTGKKLGYCVTVTFADGTNVENAEATLAGPEGVPLEAWVSTPSRPIIPGRQKNTVCLIAKAPLRPHTTYTATVSGTVDGKPWRRTWTFTTGAE
jgi:hypothetical protein